MRKAFLKIILSVGVDEAVRMCGVQYTRVEDKDKISITAKCQGFSANATSIKSADRDKLRARALAELIRKIKLEIIDGLGEYIQN